MFGRKKETLSGDSIDRSNSDQTLTNERAQHATKAQVKRATRTRLLWAFFTSLCLLISVVFVVLVEVGNTSTGSILSKMYFININVSDIVPVSIPDAVLINSIAQTLGLHDFYTVGLWNYCEGYNGQGATHCADPITLYWFDPVSILKSQLLSGATIALPAEIDNILKLIRIVSHWMFGLFMTGICINFVMIFIVPLSVISRWVTLPIMIFTFFGALFTTVAAVIATVLFVIMKNAITSATSLNIQATIGVKMFAFMWVAAAFAIIAWVIQLSLSCCCASRRDVKTGRKTGSKKAWRIETSGTSEKPAERVQDA